MRRYETIFIITPDSSEEDLKAVATKFKGVITEMNGHIGDYTEQGSKKLAYSVKKNNKGLYVLMDYVGSPDLVAEIERNMRLDDRILKYLTVKLADSVDPESIQDQPSEPEPETEPEPVSEPESEPEAEVTDEVKASEEES